MIEFQNLTVCYAPHARHPINAIEKINLKINKGEWIFLVGPSGAGKSTLLKLLHCGLHAPTKIEGRVTLDGQNLVDLSPKEVPYVRRKTGVVFQDFQLLAQKTAWENIAFALRVIGAPQKRIARDVPRVLDTVGLAHKAHAQPHELSGGEQQRVAIARAIVNNPTLLLADEPTGNLDPDTASGIAEVLRRINEELGTTVVMATHDRMLVDAMKKRVVRVRDGGIASDEEGGVYHLEDDEPAPAKGSTPSAGSPAQNTPVKNERIEIERTEIYRPAIQSAPPIENKIEDVNSESPKGAEINAEPVRSFEPPSEPPAKIHLGEPTDPFSRDTLQNEAPVGSDENPIVQYGKQ